jgi:hypothetical protein
VPLLGAGFWPFPKRRAEVEARSGEQAGDPVRGALAIIKAWTTLAAVGSTAGRARLGFEILDGGAYQLPSETSQRSTFIAFLKALRSRLLCTLLHS